jgi:hypothetical protein
MTLPHGHAHYRAHGGDQAAQPHTQTFLPKNLGVAIHRCVLPFLALGASTVEDPMVRHVDGRRHIDDRLHARHTDPSSSHLAIGTGHDPMLHQLRWCAVGTTMVVLGRTFFCCFFASACGFFPFALTHSGGGVFCFSRSSMRTRARRSSQLVVFRSKVCDFVLWCQGLRFSERSRVNSILAPGVGKSGDRQGGKKGVTSSQKSIQTERGPLSWKRTRPGKRRCSRKRKQRSSSGSPAWRNGAREM